MIGSIKGKVLEKRVSSLLVEAGSIGYIVRTTTDLISKTREGSEITLLTHLAVRENSLDLYGFKDSEDLSVFELLLDVSGIGPKSALTILGVAGREILKEAVSTGDSSRLTAIGGIGKKTAEKIVVELSGKLVRDGAASLGMQEDMDVLEALKTLGYRERDIQETIKLLPKDLEGANSKIKEALKILSKK